MPETAKILFAVTDWDMPILATNSPACKEDIRQAGWSMDDHSIIESGFSGENGIYLWVGQYDWGDEAGPDVKQHEVRRAAIDDFVDLGFPHARATPKTTIDDAFNTDEIVTPEVSAVEAIAMVMAVATEKRRQA